MSRRALASAPIGTASCHLGLPVREAQDESRFIAIAADHAFYGQTDVSADMTAVSVGHAAGVTATTAG